MSAELQRHFAKMKALCAEPDGTEVDRGPGRQPWAKIIPIICPMCRDVFFTYGPVSQSGKPPLEQGEDPPRGCGTRQTCGHPLCHKNEQEHQRNRRAQGRMAYALT